MIHRRTYREKKEVQLTPLQDDVKLTMLESVNKIIELVENSKLSKQFYDQAAPYIKVLMDSQGFSQIQSVMVALIAEATSMDDETSLSDIADFVDCNGIQIM